MPYQFCPCGAKSEYDITPLDICPKCGISFDKFFKEEIKKKETSGSQKTIPQIRKPTIGKSKTYAELEAEEFVEEDYDEGSAKDLAEEIKASLNENDIIVNINEEGPVKLGALGGIYDGLKDKK